MRPASLLLVTAIVEVGAGIALLLLPAVAFELLLGVISVAPEALIVGRVAGAALLALGVASWLSRNDPSSPALRGLVSGLLAYNTIVAIVLTLVGFAGTTVGSLLWPAVVLHIALAGWCVGCLRSAR